MTQYIIIHTTKFGERDQLTGAWEASSEGEALAKMFLETSTDDDGNYAAFPVTSPADIIF
jgi:hypothetical protein